MRETVAEIMKNPQADVAGAVSKSDLHFFLSNSWLIRLLLWKAAVYGTSQSIPDRSMVSEITGIFLESLYNLKQTGSDKDASNGHKH